MDKNIKENILNLSVEGQKLSCDGEERFLVENAINYLEFVVNFSDEWAGLSKQIFFTQKNYTVGIKNMANGHVPSEVIRAPGFSISIIGEKFEGEELKTRITTNPIHIPLNVSGPLRENLSHVPEQQSTIQELQNSIQKLIRKVQELEDLIGQG